MDPNLLQYTHVKLLASHIGSLTPVSSHSASSSDLKFFTRKWIQVSRVEVLGIVVFRDFKPGKFLRFAIDDGSGCVQCILWLNQMTSSFFARRRPIDVRVIAQIATGLSARVQIGLLVRVRGRLSVFRGSVQVTIEDVVVERDPNTEILHWLDCIRLARERYDILAP